MPNVSGRASTKIWFSGQNYIRNINKSPCYQQSRTPSLRTPRDSGNDVTTDVKRVSRNRLRHFRFEDSKTTCCQQRCQVMVNDNSNGLLTGDCAWKPQSSPVARSSFQHRDKFHLFCTGIFLIYPSPLAMIWFFKDLTHQLTRPVIPLISFQL